MVEIIFKLLVLVPAVLGVSEIIHLIKMAINSPSKKPKNYWVVMLEEGSAEQQLKYAILKHTWQNSEYKNLVVITNNVSGEELDVCKELAQKYGIELNKNII